MIKLIIFFRQPANPDQFEERFANHVQLIGKMPGMKRTVVNRAIGAPRGEPAYFLIHEVFFTDLAAANYALNAPEGRMAGADLMSFAREITTLLFTEVWGEDPEPVADVAEPVAEVSPELEAELAAEQSLAVAPASVATTPAAAPVSNGASLNTTAATTATAMAMAVANAAPQGLAAAPLTDDAVAPSGAPELDALPIDQEVFGIYSTLETVPPTPPPLEVDDVAAADIADLSDELALENAEVDADAPEVVEAALLDGAVVDGEIITDAMPAEDVDAETSGDKPAPFGP